MQNHLINEPGNSFYKGCFLRLTSIESKIDSFVSNNFKLYVNISDEEEINERWLIEANGVVKSEKIFKASYMPFFEINLSEVHPLLWYYQHDEIVCELKGVSELEPNKFLELIGEISKTYDKQMGGFIRWENEFRGLQNHKSGSKIYLWTNSRTFEIVKDIVDEFKLELEILNKEERNSKPELKVLLIRNPHISEKDYFWSQSYIIANEFKFKKIKYTV